MRTIKFRVYDIYKKRYLPDDVYSILNKTTFGAFGVMIMDWEDYREGEYLYEDAQILEQFTGLTDKDESQIFEGDVVKKGEITYKITWNSLHAMWGLFTERGQSSREILCDTTDGKGKMCKFWRDNSLTVIGNIHDNPELITN